MKQALVPDQIPFLHIQNTLYVSDFRAISESMSYKIPAMWKYENLLPWILKDQTVTVNEDANRIEYSHDNERLEVAKAEDPRISVFERIKPELPAEKQISSLWTAIPHPKADEFAQKLQLTLNYTYSDFQRYNDKIHQKEILKQYTPEWRVITSLEDLAQIMNSNSHGFIKRRHGSGGYTVFSVSQVKNDKNFKDLFSNAPEEWYWEAFFEGVPHSVQCVRINKTSILFGFAEQLIADGKYFMGLNMRPLKELDGALGDQLQKVLELTDQLLHDYEGFFGIDFMLDPNNQVSVLEANVRLTAATIPTLIMNEANFTQAEFKEDVPESEIQTKDMALTRDTVDATADVLRGL